MNIKELQDELKKRKIHLTGRAISKIWEMDETSFSKKKKEGTQIKQKNIEQLEQALGIKLIEREISLPAATLKRRYDPDIETKLKECSARIELIKSRNNLSSHETAGLLNISEAELADILSGRALPDLNFINRLKQNFDISADWVLYGG